MSVGARSVLLMVAFLVLAVPVLRVAQAMPAFGAGISSYGAAVNAIIPGLRHVANMVTAVNFDVRGIDTVGEELMLIAAVTGTVVLLRGSRGEDPADEPDTLPGRAIVPRSDAVVAVSRVGATAIVVFGIYIVMQGTQTPGGGFQAGVLIASGFAMLYIGEGYDGWRRLMPSSVMAALEGGGGLVFVVAAAIPLAIGQPALTNVIPTNSWKSFLSGGTMIVGNFAVAVAVAGSFGALMVEFLEETRAPGGGDDKPEQEEE